MNSIIPDWIKGDILKVQYLQSLYSHLEQSVARTILSQPYNYGINSISMDLSDTGVVRINRIDAIFPDGTIVNQSCNVQTTLPAVNSGKVYITIPTRENQMRYQKSIKEVSDLHDHYDIALVKCLEYQVNLIVSASEPLQCVSLPITQLTGVNTFDKNYIYPAIFLDQFTGLTQKLLDFIRLLKEKLQVLKNHTLFASLFPLIFLLEYTLKSGHVKPFEIYQILIQIYSWSYTLRAYYQFPDVVLYNHCDIHNVFSTLIKGVANNMKSVLSVKSLALEAINPLHFVLDISPSHALQESYLALEFEFSEMLNTTQMIDWITNATIEDSSLSASMQRVLGANRKIVRKINEFGLEERTNVILVLIEKHQTYLQLNEQLNIKNTSNEHGPRSVKLYCYSDVNAVV